MLAITPTEFELRVKEWLDSMSGTIEDYRSEHEEPMLGMDGVYEIDVTVRFSILGADFTVLIECKRWSDRVKRSIVTDLQHKKNSVGAQKAMIVSTSGFQSGAVECAKSNGIALIEVREGGFSYRTRDYHGTTPDHLDGRGFELWSISALSEGRTRERLLGSEDSDISII